MISTVALCSRYKWSTLLPTEPLPPYPTEMRTERFFFVIIGTDGFLCVVHIDQITPSKYKVYCEVVIHQRPEVHLSPLFKLPVAFLRCVFSLSLGIIVSQSTTKDYTFTELLIPLMSYLTNTYGLPKLCSST